MRMKIQVVTISDNGEETTQDVASLERGELLPENLGLSIQDGKTILKGVQETLVDKQVEASFRVAKRCSKCCQSRNTKGYHDVKLRTIFGSIQIKSPRLHHCLCEDSSAKTFSPLAKIISSHTTPELLFLEAKWSSTMSYGMTAKLIEDVLPVDEPIQPVTIRNHVLKLAERMELSLAEEHVSFVKHCQREREELPIPDGPITVGIDGGYVRSHNKRGCFEIIVGKSIPSFLRDDPSQALATKSFAFVQTHDEKPKRRLYEVLKSQGLQENQQITFLSDGGDTVRKLQMFMSPEAEHILDWFHVTMRLTVLRQMAKGLADQWEFEGDKYPVRKPILKSLKSIKWLLWNGNVFRALQKVNDIFFLIEGTDEAESGKPMKFYNTISDFRTYIENNQGFIPNYGERHRHKERISTGFVESTVNQVITKRMMKKQQMRWSQRGAHLLLQVRTRVVNEELESVFQEWYPEFRKVS